MEDFYMDKDKINWSKGVLESVDLASQRIQQETFNKKQQLLLLKVIGDLINTLSASVENKEIVEGLITIQGELEAPQISDINLNIIKDMKQKIAAVIGEYEKISYIQHALQLDAQSIIPLLEQIRQKQEEVRQSFQMSVDIDFTLYGKVSEVTLGAMEAFHFNVNSDKQVIAVAELPQEDKSQVTDNKKNRQYLKIPPQGKKQFQETVAYLKENGAQFDGIVKKWYITEACDKGKFVDFLEKDSVLEKLSEKKKAANEKNEKDTSRGKTMGVIHREETK